MQNVRISQCRAVFLHRIAEMQVVIQVAFRNGHPDAFCSEPVVCHPMKLLCTFGLDPRNLLFFPFYPNGEFGGVSECIGERVREVIRFLFFYVDDSPVDAFAETEAVTRFYETAHIEGTALCPFLIIDVAVQEAGLVESEAVQVAMVDNLAVQTEGNIFHSVDVCRIIHIIVGFNRQSDFSPGFDLTGDGLLAIFGRDRFKLQFTTAAVDHSFALLRADQDSLYFRRTGIGYLLFEIFDRVEDLFTLRVAHFEMEMRTSRTSGVSTVGDDFPFFDRELVRVEEQVHVEAFLLVLLCFEVSGDGRSESLQMAVDGCRPVRMCQV